MKLPTSPSTLLAAAALLLPVLTSADTTSTTTSETRNLRGKVVRTRTVHIHHDKGDSSSTPSLRAAEPLVDPRKAAAAPRPTPTTSPAEHHHYVRVNAKGTSGQVRSFVMDLDQLEDIFPHDSPIFTKNHHHFHDEEEKNTPGKKMRGGATTTTTTTKKTVVEDVLEPSPHASLRNSPQGLHSPHGSHRADHDIHHDHEASEEHHHFVGHDEVERQHEHHYHPGHHHKTAKQNKTHTHSHHTEEREDEFDWKRARTMYALPTGLSSHFNETLFDELHDAPFRVYEEALGHELDEGESFPVFALPQWMNTTGVFTGFSKSADPLIFENVQFLLHWGEIVSASNSPVPPELAQHITDNNFHASLIVGKSIGNGSNVPFIGMIICYYQFGSPKNVLVPFSMLEDFFDDTSEKHLLDPDTKSLEMAALHEMLDEKRGNNTSFFHPALAHTEERKAQLEDLEITHFQKLFQLLIRRSFLFSFGYADCLMKEPRGLRRCLDDTFYSLIAMETTVRGALDDQVLEQLAKINETFHSKVSEACISVQGTGTGIMYGSGSCYNANDLGAFVGNYGSF